MSREQFNPETHQEFKILIAREPESRDTFQSDWFEIVYPSGLKGVMSARQLDQTGMTPSPATKQGR